MKAVLVIALGLIALVSAQYAGVAKMVGTTNDPSVTGSISFVPSGGLTLMSVNLKGINVNNGSLHGIHIHQYGDISDPAGAAPGGHWNPLAQNHGCENITQRHMGDTGNWMVNGDGTLVQNKTLDLIGLFGTNSVIGFAVIFHSLTDDCNYTLSSGARLAQGVIGIANPSYYGITSNAAVAVPSYGTTAICNLANANGTGISGWIRFDQATSTSPTFITAQIAGLASGSLHGFHVHQWGDFTTQDANSAGPHFTGPVLNAFQAHSIPGSGFEHHVGDMGNLYFYDSGFAYYMGNSTDFGLWGSTNGIVGRAVIVHEKADNCGQPYGNAGNRWAICIIGAANPSYGGNQTFPVGLSVPTDQNSTACVYATTGVSTAFMTSGAVTSSQMTSGAVTSSQMTSGAVSTGVEKVSSLATVIVIAPFTVLLAALFAFFMN